MTDKEQILQIIFGAIDEINKLSLSARKLDKTPDVKLYGKDGQLDSLMLVNLIVAIEQNIEEEFEVSLTIADEKAMSQKNSPFRTISSLAEYLEVLLNKESPAKSKTFNLNTK